MDGAVGCRPLGLLSATTDALLRQVRIAARPLFFSVIRLQY